MLAAGLILVGSYPGGTASNVICFISKGMSRFLSR
ncbi:MAG TPA: hypothetical protein DCM38_06160 [Gammaproteobacteria bacterium]|nr:hypothetical protein [Gammaproteobacteria bacterium]